MDTLSLINYNNNYFILMPIYIYILYYLYVVNTSDNIYYIF